jgi:hypothetical protein
MMTPDKDYGQLVSDNTYMYKPARGGGKAEILGKKEICEKYGIKDLSKSLIYLQFGETRQIIFPEYRV